MTKHRVNYRKIDAGHRTTTSLRAGNFRKIAGAPIIGGEYKRRRRWLYAAAAAILIIGGYFSFC